VFAMAASRRVLVGVTVTATGQTGSQLTAVICMGLTDVRTPLPTRPSVAPSLFCAWAGEQVRCQEAASFRCFLSGAGAGVRFPPLGPFRARGLRLCSSASSRLPPPTSASQPRTDAVS
jgi:hypothetical protein